MIIIYAHFITDVQTHNFRAYIWFYIKFKSTGQMISQHTVQMKVRCSLKKSSELTRSQTTNESKGRPN